MRVATLPWRIAGGVIDALLVVVVSGLTGAWLSNAELRTTQVRIDAVSGASSVISSATSPPWFLAAMPVLITAVYTIVLIGLWGRTVGGWAVGIRCVPLSPRTGAPLIHHRPGLVVAAKRWLVLYGIAGLISMIPVLGGLSWLVILVVALSPLWDRSGRMQGLQDRFAGDLVIRDEGRRRVGGAAPDERGRASRPGDERATSRATPATPRP